MNNNIEVLEEVLDVLEDERKHFLDLVNQNEFRMEEINSYLRELSKSEDEDFKVFSPRNVENMHREQIEADVSEKKKYEEEPDIPEENKNEDKDTLESDHIAHQILNCVSFIAPDADRAKVELTALAKKLSDDTIYRK